MQLIKITRSDWEGRSGILSSIGNGYMYLVICKYLDSVTPIKTGILGFQMVRILELNKFDIRLL